MYSVTVFDAVDDGEIEIRDQLSIINILKNAFLSTQANKGKKQSMNLNTVTWQWALGIWAC